MPDDPEWDGTAGEEDIDGLFDGEEDEGPDPAVGDENPSGTQKVFLDSDPATHPLTIPGDGGLIIESATGTDAPRYAETLERLLRRLIEAGYTIDGAELVSKDAQQLSPADRELASDRLGFPAVFDPGEVRKAIAAAAAGTGRAAGAKGSGNPTRRVLLRLRDRSGAHPSAEALRSLTGGQGAWSTPRLVILEGPPGTGKTYHAAREAVYIIDGKIGDTPAEVRGRYRTLVRAHRIFAVTFHAGYSYEDFVEGFRPQNTGGVLDYRVVKGPLRKAIDACRVAAPLSSLFEMGTTIPTGTPGLPPYVVREVQTDGLVLSKAQSRSDQGNPENWFYVDFWTVQRILDSGLTKVAFGGKQNDEKAAVAVRLKFALGWAAYASHFQAVVSHVRRQLAATPTGMARPGPVVLLIDEINRADLSRVFGELITLVEADKREGAAEESFAELPYSGDTLAVPATLHIVGTMNTADRSLSVFDFALRRRFSFRYVAPEPTLCPASYGGIDIRRFLQGLNGRIEALLGRELCIGHAELMEEHLEVARRSTGYGDDDAGRARTLAGVIKQKILPTLLAYSGQDWIAVRALLGDGLVTESPAPDFGDDIDVSSTLYTYSPRCDPDSATWDEAWFRQAFVVVAVGTGAAPGTADLSAATGVDGPPPGTTSGDDAAPTDGAAATSSSSEA